MLSILYRTDNLWITKIGQITITNNRYYMKLKILPQFLPTDQMTTTLNQHTRYETQVYATVSNYNRFSIGDKARYIDDDENLITTEIVNI